VARVKWIWGVRGQQGLGVREGARGGGGGGEYVCERGGSERGGGGGGVYSESYARGARFLTRWDQHAVAQPALTRRRRRRRRRRSLLRIIHARGARRRRSLFRIVHAVGAIPGGGGVYLESYTREARFLTRWSVVLLMRYLGIVWGPGYPREQVGALRPPIVSKGRPGRPSSNPRINLGQPS
jgi:hypothetical protein